MEKFFLRETIIFWVTNEELDECLAFREKLNKLRETDNKIVIFIDIIVLYWLIVTGKLHLLKDSDRVEGSFLFLKEEEAIGFENFKETMYIEWRSRHFDD